MIGFDFYGSPGDGAELVAPYGVDGILFAMVKIVSDRIFKKNQSKKALLSHTFKIRNPIVTPEERI